MHASRGRHWSLMAWLPKLVACLLRRMAWFDTDADFGAMRLSFRNVPLLWWVFVSAIRHCDLTTWYFGFCNVRARCEMLLCRKKCRSPRAVSFGRAARRHCCFWLALPGHKGNDEDELVVQEVHDLLGRPVANALSVGGRGACAWQGQSKSERFSRCASATARHSENCLRSGAIPGAHAWATMCVFPGSVFALCASVWLESSCQKNIRTS